MMERRRVAWLAQAGLAVVMLFTASCGPSGPKLYPVQGKVMFAGKPAAGALVTLHKTDAENSTTPIPSGIVREDGSFQLSTYGPNDGAPAGEYDVAITWTEEKGNADTGDLKSKLPLRYSDPKTSQLKATIGNSATTLPTFELTK